MALETTPIRDALSSHAAASGRFERVSGHEPKNAPGNGITAAVWIQERRPIPLRSGLAVSSARVVFWLRVYHPAFTEPPDDIDPAVDRAVDALMLAYSGDFTLGGLIAEVDLLGAYGEPLSSRAGYQTIAQTMYRIVTLVIPCIVNDCWTQAP